MLVRQEKQKKIGTAVNAAGYANISACHRFVSPGALRESGHCPLQEGGT